MWLSRIFYPIDRWLPADWPELDESALQQAVKNLASQGQSWTTPSNTSEPRSANRQTRVDLLRAACCLFWHLFYWPERYTVAQLEELRTVWRYKYESNEPLDWTQAYMSIHLAGALALHLYSTKAGFTEALREIVDYITRMAAYLKSVNSLTEPSVYYQDDPEYFNETVPIRKSLAIVCSLGWCFNFYIAKVDGEPKRAFDSAFEAFSCADAANPVHRFSAEPRAAIEQNDVSLGLVAIWMRAQDIAEVFDGIHRSVEPKVNWAELAARCEEMRFYHERANQWAEDNRFWVDRFVDPEIAKLQSDSGSKWSPGYTVSEFWTFARALCIYRLSPDAYRKLREGDERQAAQDRLRKYFFANLWDTMPLEAREALITADRIYWATEGRKGDILENLRLAVEPIIEERLAAPFRVWRSKLAKQSITDSQAKGSEAFLLLTKLLHELWDNRKLFVNFCRNVFPEVEDRFWEDLRDALYKLRDLRGAVAHPEDREPAAPDKILEHYCHFVGIGRQGILYDLLTLHPRQ